MRKLQLFTLLMCMLCTLTACGNKQKETVNTVVEVETTSEVEAIIEEEIPEPVSEVVEVSSEAEEEQEQEQTTLLPEVLSLKENHYARYEWSDDTLLVRCEYSNVTMADGGEEYPDLEQRLSETAVMMNRSMEYEADNILSFMQEMGLLDSEDFETQVSTSEVQVRRADSVVVSLLADSFADYGFIDEVRGMIGTTYDTQTGEMLVLSDVITDMGPVPSIVEKELNSHIWNGDLYSDTIVEEYFANTPEDGFSWTLDYNGVTFYFGDGDIAEPGNGRLTATVSFAEYPELFNEKYMSVPQAYMVELPMDSSFFADLDADGTLEELNCTGFNDDVGSGYTDFGLYTDTDGYYHYEECFAYDFNPYYVKTADGNHYLYVFREESDVENRQMVLMVYNVTGAKFAKVGEMNVAPQYLGEDAFVLPLDPDSMWLESSDDTSGAAEYYAGDSGMPVRK